MYTIAKDCAVYVWHVRKQEDQAVEALTQTTSDTGNELKLLRDVLERVSLINSLELVTIMFYML